MKLYASSPRKDKSGYERLQGIAEARCSDASLASSSTAPFPGRNECPETDCSLIVPEKKVPARKFEVKGKRRGQRESRIREEKWQTCWCSRDQQKACTIAQASAENLEHTGLAKNESGLSATK